MCSSAAVAEEIGAAPPSPEWWYLLFSPYLFSFLSISIFSFLLPLFSSRSLFSFLSSLVPLSVFPLLAVTWIVDLSLSLPEEECTRCVTNIGGVDADLCAFRAVTQGYRMW